MPVSLSDGNVFANYQKAHSSMICIVINQMDTSQAHLSSKPGAATKDSTKPDNLSKDELTAVLKYGAQKM